MTVANEKKVNRWCIYYSILSNTEHDQALLCFVRCTKYLDVQIHGHVKIPRLSTAVLRQGTLAAHLPRAGSA